MATRATAKQPAGKAASAKAKSPRKTAPTEETTAKKAAAKKATAKKVPAKKVPAKKAPVKKAPVKKAPVKKVTTKKAATKQATAKNVAAKKAATKKVPAKKVAAARASIRPRAVYGRKSRFSPQAAKELSGASWVAKFPGSDKVSDLADPFKANVTSFISAMTAAKAKVIVSSTYRRPERLYLMHWSWKLNKGEVKASGIPAMAGVDIEWDHGDEATSQKAAKAMVAGYNIVKEPSLTSRHSQKKAIDMTISWTGDLTIKNKDGTEVAISTEPLNGENDDLIAVGKTYSVIKATFSGDPPHWSTDGS